jgi:hypothetical protein
MCPEWPFVTPECLALPTGVRRANTEHGRDRYRARQTTNQTLAACEPPVDVLFWFMRKAAGRVQERSFCAYVEARLTL